MKKTHNIEEVLENICKALDISFSRITKEEHVNQLFYIIHTPDAAYFLERGAEGLRALNTITRQLAEGEQFSVDINHYQIKKINSLQEQARTLARRAQTLECEIEMPPMSSYDRMIVHEALKDDPSVTTESRGEGRLRHVVILCV